MPSPIKKILVVDDDLVQLRLLDDILKDKGYDVFCASEAAEGLQHAMDKSVDLIILDVMMPIINGYNFCNLIKSHEKKKHTPIILVTGRDAREDVEIGMQAGADAYLTKPINMDELLKTIRMVESQIGKN